MSCSEAQKKIKLCENFLINNDCPYLERLNFLKVLIRARAMGIEKVIKLVIKIFTWFYQKWISKIKIKSANKTDLKEIQH